MTRVIVVTNDEAERRTLLRPDRSPGFSLGESRWYSLAHYLLAMRAASPEGRERVRAAIGIESARAVASELPEDPSWPERAESLLREAVRACYAHHLRARATLLGTGEATIELRTGDPLDPLLSSLLIEARAWAAIRASDASAVQCGHEGERAAMCAHLVTSEEYLPKFQRFFTGNAAEHRLLCPACAASEPASAPLRAVCVACKQEALNGTRGEDVGSLGCAERDDGLCFVPSVVSIAGLGSAPLVASVAAHDSEGQWLALASDGALYRVDARRSSATLLMRLDPTSIDLAAPVALYVSRGQRFAVVVERRGTRGALIDLSQRAVSRSLSRGDYHVEYCDFPIAFVEHGGRTRLVHGTDWNRLEVSDALTGEALTERPIPDSKGEHYLDYFHCALSVSEDQRWIADGGWHWHPVGVVRTWSVDRWLGGNPNESEDGESVRSFAAKDYAWSLPMCWTAERSLAVWGVGEDDLELLPGVDVFDVHSGEKLRTFVGPPRGLDFDRWLISYGESRDSAVWDARTGERLAVERTFAAQGWHRGLGALYALEADGTLRLAELRGE